jgi:dUTP pyrophosphatase
MAFIEFTKMRDVKSPSRGNQGDAGIDFYVPHLITEDLLSIAVNGEMYRDGMVIIDAFRNGLVMVRPGGRLLIPSGIRVLLPPGTMLMAANKSGISSKYGILYTCEIVDHPYTGEVHLGIYNSGHKNFIIDLNEGIKLMQFIHMPIIESEMREIDHEEYEAKAKVMNSTRGNHGFGSTGIK